MVKRMIKEIDCLRSKKIETYFFRTEYTFASRILQWAFGLYIFLVGVKKLRVDGQFDPVDGILSFAASIQNGAMNTEILAREFPGFLLFGYGLILPLLELASGVLLLANRQVKIAYILVGLIYLSFVFGQMYSGNTGKIGTDYLPSLVALCVAVFATTKDRQAIAS